MEAGDQGEREVRVRRGWHAGDKEWQQGCGMEPEEAG